MGRVVGFGGEKVGDADHDAMERSWERKRTVRGKKEMCRVLPFAPLDTVDFLLNLERLEVVEFRLVRLAREHPNQRKRESDQIS